MTFDEDAELVVFDISSLKVLLECEEENKQELVVLVQTAACVAEHLECQVLDHVVQSLAGKWRLLRSTPKGKGKGRTLVTAPLCRQALPQRRSGTWRAPSSVAHTCLIPS